MYLIYSSDISSREHLYRDHLIYPCARCGDISRKQDDLEKHLRQPESCAVVNWKSTFDRAQGFDNQQEKDIRRKTIRSWQAVFKILFPEDAEHTYPPQSQLLQVLVVSLTNFNQITVIRTSSSFLISFKPTITSRFSVSFRSACSMSPSSLHCL